MQHVQITDLRSEWRIVAGTRRTQAALMTIAPGGKEGGPRNKHDADQYLYVLSGRGKAKVKKQELELLPGSLLLVEAGETHEIRNDGTTALVTLNLYAPPEFDEDGDPL